ncbi:MAG TPA: MEDS domain-containing protein [Candidatus Limnocylindria bacterium]|jgi:hypothetical protein
MRAKPAGAEHTVHFYDRPASLAHRIADFAATGLERGEAAIIIATAEHRMATEGRLVALGVDLGSAAAEGRYLPLDAAETLEQLMVDGHPDRARFNEVVGGPVQRAQQARPGLRAYGEMVGLLWSEGKHDAAMALEELWNDLLGHHPFSLMCGYPARRLAFGGSGLARIVDVHTDVARLAVAPA